MKFNDALWGAALLVLAGLLLVHVQGFPAMPGQRIGPAVLPGAIAVGLGLCGALLVLRGLRHRRGAGGEPWFERPDWLASTPHQRAFAVLVAVNVLYVAAAQQLGFILTGVIYLASLLAALRVPLKRSLWLAVVMTLVIHFVFYKLLRVPLPWGVLQGAAW